MNDCTHNSQCFELPQDAETSSEHSKTNVKMDVEETAPTPTPAPAQDDSDSDAEFEKLLWSIEDDTLFHPLGLSNHGTDAGKTVFVTWSEDYLLNFVFKRARRTKTISLTKVRLAMPAGEVVEDIFILELNALLLMRSGSVYYFSSVKSMHAVQWLCGVRCLAKAQSGFSVIRLRADNTLHLEVYKEVVNLGKSASTLLHSYDITYDALNLFNCQWQDERFTLLTLQVEEENLVFIQLLVGGECEMHVRQELHLFTVSGMVFALIPASTPMDLDAAEEHSASAHYNIQPLFSYSSNVHFIQVDCTQRRCLIFLQCGSIEIWYMSRNTPAALQRTTHHTGAQYTHCVYAASQGCFYYTDQQQVAQLQFHYDATTDLCHVQETYKAIPGIVACTWAQSLQQLICLSCNNIFYKITFESATANDANLSGSTAEYESLNTLYELTPARMAKLLTHAQVVQELTQVPTLLHNAIEQEYVQQQLLAVASKQHLYRNLCKASLAFSTQLPMHSTQAPHTLIYTNRTLLLHADSVLACIQLRITKNEILENALWHLHIDYDGQTQLMRMPTTLLQQQLLIVVPLVRKSARELLPHFKLKLYALVRQKAEFVAITLPIELEVDAGTYSGLFSVYKRSLTLCHEYDLADLVTHFKQQQQQQHKTTTSKTEAVCGKTTNSAAVRHTLSLQKACSFSAIVAAFGVSATTLQSPANFEFYFLSHAVAIAYAEREHCITLESSDAIALFYTKLHLLSNVSQLASNKDAKECLQQLVMQLQTDLARCATTLLHMTDLAELQASHALHLENLQRIYAKLRRDVCILYS